jgi:hypothetical protein
VAIIERIRQGDKAILVIDVSVWAFDVIDQEYSVVVNGQPIKVPAEALIPVTEPAYVPG